jgi:NAD(P)H-hydrate epimerase
MHETSWRDLLAKDCHFWTEDGIPVPAVTEEQMREIDRIAMQDFGLGFLQMMENAGRALAMNVLDILGGLEGAVVILAGSGGNGGGGICCARHLHNRGLDVQLLLSKAAKSLSGAAASQYRILDQTGFESLPLSHAEQALSRADVIVDALIGYTLNGAPRGAVAELIQVCNHHAKRVLSLDLPSGLDATTGEQPGICVRADRILTLALPKTGLCFVEGELILADIGLPPEIFRRLDIDCKPFFGARAWVRITKQIDA